MSDPATLVLGHSNNPKDPSKKEKKTEILPAG